MDSCCLRWYDRYRFMWSYIDILIGIHNKTLGYPQPKDPKVLIATQKLAVEVG